tara:strand:+ start:1098 stop:1415 length:318 start_codon:yes stop_codon:yes gene_type:complete
MERLLKIANDMDDEAQRESLVGQRCFRVTDHIGEAPERGDGVPFRRSANLLIALGVGTVTNCHGLAVFCQNGLGSERMKSGQLAASAIVSEPKLAATPLRASGER